MPHGTYPHQNPNPWKNKQTNIVLTMVYKLLTFDNVVNSERF